MKNKLISILGAIVLAVVIMPITKVNAAPLEASDEATLRSTILSGGEITLTDNIETKEPIEVSNEVVINGNGKTISAAEDFNTTNINQTILSVNEGGKLTLKNVTIADSKKYGLQAHQNGILIIDGVTVKNSNFGAILINGGQVTIKNLTMIDNAYGIEFGKGDGVTEASELIVDGTIEGTQETMLHIDLPNPETDKISIKNTENTKTTIVLEDNKLVVKDDKGTVIGGTTTEVKADLDLSLKPVQTPEPEEEPSITEETAKGDSPEENPKTGDNGILYIATAILGVGATMLVSKKLVNNL